MIPFRIIENIDIPIIFSKIMTIKCLLWGRRAFISSCKSGLESYY
ncbi:MAG: hypothetical protein ACTSO4_11095 [Promethearchaeota archaeon]